MNYLEILKTTENIAREAGGILMDYYGKVHNIKYKRPGDVVTEADVASEEYITRRLKSEFPCYAVLGEEFGLSKTELELGCCWAIDPLDGTANYAMHFPIFAVSIGLLRDGDPVVGVVYDPNNDRIFCAAKGHGTTMDGNPIAVNPNAKISSDGLFGFASRMLHTNHHFISNFLKGRSLGSAALQLCAVASGFFDGTTDLGTKLWDIAAGAVILAEAGGRISSPQGTPIFPLPKDSSAYNSDSVPFLATNGVLHNECIEHFRKEEGPPT